MYVYTGIGSAQFFLALPYAGVVNQEKSIECPDAQNSEAPYQRSRIGAGEHADDR